MAIRRTSTSGLSNRAIYIDGSAGNSKIVDIPDTPTIGTATAGAESATVTYTAALTGGTATTFTALSNPGSITGTGSSPITVSGLTASTAYTFTIKAENTTGDSAYSSASNSATPTSSINPSYDSIATVTVAGANALQIDFSSIPSTYTHLQIRSVSTGTDNTNVRMRFNDNSSVAYGYHGIQGGPGYGASLYTNYAINETSMMAYDQQLGTSTNPNATITDILEYANTNKYKTTRTLSGSHSGSTNSFIFFQSGLWYNSSAINKISLYPVSNTFRIGSTFALYGIKG